MMEYDLKTYLPNDVLTKVDRMSMRVSLEAREPLLDHRLVELAATIPSRLKIRGGVGKHILKQVMAPFLPADVLEKRKQGFSVPLGTWLRTDLRSDILDTLRSGNGHGFFDSPRRRAADRRVLQGRRLTQLPGLDTLRLRAVVSERLRRRCADRRGLSRMSQPLVTVVIPAYNAERDIGEALASDP